MKNNRIVRAYDSINPSPVEKAKMLDAILAEANLEEKPTRERKKKNTVVYTAKAPKTSKRSYFMAVAASLILLLISGLVLMQMVNRRDVTPAYEKPTAAMEASIPEKTVVDHYEPVLEKYRRAIAEGWAKEECEIEGISTRMETGGDFTKAGYVFLDLDGDGREELIIAEESTDRTDNIWDLYTTLEDGTPIQLWVDEQTGGQCRLYEGNVISISDSYKDKLEMTFYELKAGQLVMRESLQWEDEDTVFHTDADGNTRQVTSREGQDISYAYDGQKLNLTWLADIPDYFRDTESVEGYTPILEKYKTALTEGWTEHLCEENDISPQLFEGLAGYQSPGWCLLDLDSNGVEELIISDGVYLYDLYTMMPDNSGPGHILCANGGETYQLCENGVIEKHGLYSGTTAWRYYTLRDIDLVQQDMVFYEGAINQYSYGTWDNDLQPITKEKAGEIIGRDQVMKLELTPFVERPDFWPEDSEQYEPLLNVYRQAVREKWNPGQCMEKGISLMVGYYGEQYDELGYAMRDLDNNGVNELIITDGTNIYDLYTLVQQGAEPMQLATAMERVQYFLTADGLIYNMGSGGAAVSYHTLYSLDGRELKLVKGYMMDADTDPDHPWFYYDGEKQLGKCPTAEAAAAMDAIVFEEIPFTSFK